MYSAKNIRAIYTTERHTTLFHTAITWLKNNPVLISSSLFFASTTLVNLGNYVFNLMLGRTLGPTLFADLSVMITLLLILTFATSALSTTVAQFTATYTAQGNVEQVAALRRWGERCACVVGIVLFLMLAVSSPFLASLFHMHSLESFIILGCGLPLFFLLAIERGILQGQVNFRQLALSQQAEMWVRLLSALLFVALGWSVNGAVGGVVLSFVASWYVARRIKRSSSVQTQLFNRAEQARFLRYIGPVVLGLLGQILINNSDILLVKHFFPSQDAGQYAALALIGRMVFFATWSVVMVMFPLVTRRQQKGEKHRSLLWCSLGIVALVSGCIILASLLLPGFVVNMLFGKQYLSIAPLLWVYALATAFYALANVIVTYHLSLGNGKGNYLVLLAGVAQVVGLYYCHTTLLLVVLVQVYIMAGLLLLLAIGDICTRKGQL